jgi:hypothetical protein
VEGVEGDLGYETDTIIRPRHGCLCSLGGHIVIEDGSGELTEVLV